MNVIKLETIVLSLNVNDRNTTGVVVATIYFVEGLELY
jgi:hypothetical protein